MSSASAFKNTYLRKYMFYQKMIVKQENEERFFVYLNGYDICSALSNLIQMLKAKYLKTGVSICK